jgi:hypothetical protein
MGDQLRDLAGKHAEHVKARVAEQARAYDAEGEVHLPGYAGSLAAFALLTSGLLVAGRVAGRGLPERFELLDVALGGIATHKFTRLLSKGSVTSPLRAPFTEFEEAAGSSELNESARGEGFRHTVGELLTCPFCLGQWIGTSYVAGLVLAPRAARTWATVFAVTGVSDMLQHVYAQLKDA